MSAYAKFLVAIGAACASAATVLADGEFSTADGMTIVAAFIGAIAVYLVPNTPQEGH
jgi:hypothetical protein